MASRLPSSRLTAVWIAAEIDGLIDEQGTELRKCSLDVGNGIGEGVDLAGQLLVAGSELFGLRPGRLEGSAQPAGAGVHAGAYGGQVGAQCAEVGAKSTELGAESGQRRREHRAFRPLLFVVRGAGGELFDPAQQRRCPRIAIHRFPQPICQSLGGPYAVEAAGTGTSP